MPDPLTTARMMSLRVPIEPADGAPPASVPGPASDSISAAAPSPAPAPDVAVPITLKRRAARNWEATAQQEDAHRPIVGPRLAELTGLPASARAALLSLGTPVMLVFVYCAMFLLAYVLTVGVSSGDACSEGAFNDALATLSTQPKIGAPGGLAMSPITLELVVFGLASGCAFSHAIEFLATSSRISAARLASGGSVQARATLHLVVAASVAVFTMQALTYSALAFDVTKRFCWIGSGPSAGLVRIVAPLRLAYWSFSNPLIVCAIGVTVGAPSFLLALSSSATCLCCLFGLGLEMLPFLSISWAVLLFLSFSCWTICLYVAGRVFVAALRLASEIGDSSRPLILFLAANVVIVWHAYPLIFLLAQFGVISNFNEQYVLAVLDGIAKLVVCNVAQSIAAIYVRAEELTARKLQTLGDIEAAQRSTEARFRGDIIAFATDLKVLLGSAEDKASAIVIRALPPWRPASTGTGAMPEVDSPLTADAGAALAAVVSTSRLVSEFIHFYSPGPQRVSRATEFGEMDVSILDLAHLSLASMVSGEEGVLSLLGKSAIRRGIRLSVDVARGVPPDIISDPTRLRLVLLALCDASLTICPRGGHVECRITTIGWRSVPVAAARRGMSATKASMPFCRVAFVDDGVGLLPHELDELFSGTDAYETRSWARPGSKVAPEEAPRTKTTRLSLSETASVKSEGESRPQRRAGALSLALRVAEALGGTVGAKAEKSKGSMLWVDLPAFSSDHALSTCLTSAGGRRAREILRRTSVTALPPPMQRAPDEAASAALRTATLLAEREAADEQVRLRRRAAVLATSSGARSVDALSSASASTGLARSPLTTVDTQSLSYDDEVLRAYTQTAAGQRALLPSPSSGELTAKEVTLAEALLRLKRTNVR